MKGYRFIVAGTNPQTDDIEGADRVFQEMRRSKLSFSTEVAVRRAEDAGAIQPARESIKRAAAAPPAWIADSLDFDASALKLPSTLATFVSLGGLVLGPPIFDPKVRSCNLPMIWSLHSSKLSRLISQAVPFTYS
jgi:hypothetical protein